MIVRTESGSFRNGQKLWAYPDMACESIIVCYKISHVTSCGETRRPRRGIQDSPSSMLCVRLRASYVNLNSKKIPSRSIPCCFRRFFPKTKQNAAPIRAWSRPGTEHYPYAFKYAYQKHHVVFRNELYQKPCPIIL